MITINVDAKIRIAHAELRASDRELLTELFTHDNPEWGKHARFGGRVAKAIPRKLVTWADVDGFFTAGRGALALVRRTLEDAGHTVRIVDRRADGWFFEAEVKIALLVALSNAGRSLYAHQIAIRDALWSRENALVRAPTGSGKTLAELAAIVQAGRHALVMVPTQALASQWLRDAEAFGMREEWLGFLGDGSRRIRPITVALPQSLRHWIHEVRNPGSGEFGIEQFGTFVVDEVQGAAAATFADVIGRVPAKFRLGVSADERRKDRKEFLIYEAFGDPVVDVKRKDLIAAGVIRDVEVRMVETTFEAPGFLAIRDAAAELRERVVAGEKIPPMTARRMKQDELAGWDALFKQMRDDEARNRLAAETVRRALDDGAQCLVFVHLREHAMELALGLRARANARAGDGRTHEIGLLLGGKSSAKEFQRVCEGIRDGSVRAAVATYKSTGVGINLPSLSAGVCVTPIHGNKQFVNQVRGRVSRKGERPAVLWYLWDREVFGDEPVRAMLRWNTNVKLVLVDGTMHDARATKGELWGDR